MFNNSLFASFKVSILSYIDKFLWELNNLRRIQLLMNKFSLFFLSPVIIPRIVSVARGLKVGGSSLKWMCKNKDFVFETFDVDILN